jgi:demethylmenaquinone methyltransferase/2-methoxy-6-polyprenyl-1,4-benzoquinol methylase
MLMYGWMKFVEIAPGRYDWAIKVMTLGRLDRIKDRIASTINPGDRVLDIGCGTGTLARRCLERGAAVTGIDSSEFMLAQAKMNAGAIQLTHRLVLIKDSVTQLRKHFEDESFDVVVSTVALGEFPGEYLDFILRDCMRVLRPGGRLVIADEVWPGHRLTRLLFRGLMVLFWIPQFLLLRRVFFPIEDLPGTIRGAGFEIVSVVQTRIGSLQTVFARKPALVEGCG